MPKRQGNAGTVFKRSGFFIALLSLGRWLVGLAFGVLIAAPVFALSSEAAGVIIAIVFATLFVLIVAVGDI
jgi:hypothetical protein